MANNNSPHKWTVSLIQREWPINFCIRSLNQWAWLALCLFWSVYFFDQNIIVPGLVWFWVHPWLFSVLYWQLNCNFNTNYFGIIQLHRSLYNHLEFPWKWLFSRSPHFLGNQSSDLLLVWTKLKKIHSPSTHSLQNCRGWLFSPLK